MATTTEVPNAEAAVNEAVRITREATRRGTESAKASLEVAHTYMDEVNVLGRQMFDTWSVEGEAIIKAAFDAQNASIDAGIALFDLGVNTNKQSIEQAVKLLKESQGAVLESWQAAVNAAAKSFEVPSK